MNTGFSRPLSLLAFAFVLIASAFARPGTPTVGYSPSFTKVEGDQPLVRTVVLSITAPSNVVVGSPVSISPIATILDKPVGVPDAVALSGLHRLWLASSGRGAYEDSTWELGWKHKFSPVWSARLAQRFADGDNHSDAYPGTKPWHDQILTTTCVLEYRVSKQLLLDATFAREVGEGLIPNTPGRAYHRTLCSLGVSGVW